MPRNIYTIMAIGVLFICSNWVYSNLTQRAAENKSHHLNTMLSQAEAEMGIQSTDTSEAYPVRAMRLARRTKALVEMKKRELDSLANADRAEMENQTPKVKVFAAGME